MSAATVVGVYATALVEAADEAGQLQQVVDDCSELAVAIADAPQLIDQVEHPAISRDQAKRLLRDLFATRVSSLVLTLLQVLIERDRFREVVAILRGVQQVADARRGRVLVQVESAIALSTGQRERLEAVLQQRFGSGVSVDAQVEPALIGGMRLRVDDRVWDASVRRNLHELEHRLKTAVIPADVWDDTRGESA